MALESIVLAVSFFSAVMSSALAHCDTLAGPVVGAARKALDSGNVNLILVWVQKNVARGRACSTAYVEYAHYVERLYDAAQTLAPEHAPKPAHTH